LALTLCAHGHVASHSTQRPDSSLVLLCVHVWVWVFVFDLHSCLSVVAQAEQARVMFLRPMQSFGVLIFGRALSGVGEASFQCIAPAFIQDYAPQGQQVLYLGIFFSSITVGTAGRITSTASFMHPPGLPTPNQKPQQQQFRRLCVQCHHLDL